MKLDNIKTSLNKINKNPIQLSPDQLPITNRYKTRNLQKDLFNGGKFTVQNFQEVQQISKNYKGSQLFDSKI